MQDRQLYEQILGITASWFVDRVELKSKDGEVQVFLAHADRGDLAWLAGKGKVYAAIEAA